MTRCSVHPEYDGSDRPRDACGTCSLLYMNAQSDRFLRLEWKTLKQPLKVRETPLHPLRALSAVAGFKAS